MSDAREKLKELRGRAGLSIRAMAEALGFNSPSSYQYYEENEKFVGGMPWPFINKLREAVEGKGEPAISKAEIAKLGDMSAIEAPAVSLSAKKPPAPSDDFLTVPIYDLRASAGPGALVEDGEPMGYQPYRSQQLARLTRSSTDSLAVITVGGDSMWETLHDGDQVLVDLSVNRIVRDGIYILSFEDELLVKRCQRDLETKEVIVKSDNPVYDNFRISSADKLNVIGRVIWIGRALG
ncbi:hypothetical protein KUV46_15845 [Thalassovita mediterranea]|nr:hypothetical protein KUV46_15845 [Thalassovita mediterranea]